MGEVSIIDLDRHADLETHGLEPCRTKDQVMAEAVWKLQF